jgi:hypothetical protein
MLFMLTHSRWAPIFQCSKEIHNALPVMRKIQYKQHENHNRSNIQIEVLKCIKHKCKIKEEEDNRYILRIQLAILIPVKEWINKQSPYKLEELNKV